MKNIAAPNKLTEGPIVKSLLALSIPIVFANILHTAYHLTDTFWVGRIGQKAVAAVSLSFPIIFLLISLGGGLAIAGTILVAQYKGKGDKKSVDYIASQTITMMCFTSVIISLTGYFGAESFISLIGAEKAVAVDAVSYLKISFLGIFFLFGFFVFQSLMRGVGDVKTPMYIVTGTVLLNLILDPIFIFGYRFIPAFGISGAAIATVVTQGLATIIGLILLFSGKYDIHLHLKNLKPDFSLIRKMFALGFPSSIEQSTRALGLAIMTFLAASFGTVTLAAYGIGFRILSFVIIPSIGLGMATSTLVGQNIGAGKVDRAVKIVKISSMIGFVILTTAGVVVFLFAKSLSAFFIPEDAEVINSSALFIKIMALTFGSIGVQQILNGAFRGAGDTLISMFLAIASLWALKFPLAYFLSKHTMLAESGVWWSFPATNIIASIIAIIYFMKGGWKEKKITEKIKTAEMVTRETIIEEGTN